MSEQPVSDYFLSALIDQANDYDKLPPKHGPYYLTREYWQMRSMARELQELRIVQRRKT